MACRCRRIDTRALIYERLTCAHGFARLRVERCARANTRGSKKAAESVCKPGSVEDDHSSRRIVADTLKQPTRRHCGPQHRLPIWSCSRWGLPCRSVTGLAVRSYRTISPLPASRRTAGGIFLLHFPSTRAAQALPGTVPCGARTFLGALARDATVRPTPPPALSHEAPHRPCAARPKHDDAPRRSR